MAAGLPYPKLSGYKSDRQRAKARHRRLRPETRYAAWQKDDQRCVFPSCRRFVEFERAHIHELDFRSAGGDPCDLDNAVTLCWRCHAEMHVRVGGKTKRIEGSRAVGLHFYQRVNDIWTEVCA